MKTSIKRTISLVIVAIIVLSCVTVMPLAQNSNTISGSTMTNEYISLAVSNSNGRFTIGTTSGNPDSETDNNKKMLYGWPSTGTSYTTVVVDGEINIYGDNGFSQSPVFNTENGTNTSSATYGDITVKQTLSIVNNNSTDREDVVEIKYEVSNKGTVNHTYGTRIMLDTMLGSNDNAPFRIPEVGAVTTQSEFSGNNIPQYWQAFDSLTDPKVVAQGSFLRSSINKPDKVQFTNWEKVKYTPWNCPVSLGSSNGDSAVTVTWNSKTIVPGETKTYTTHYGLSELVQDLKPPLAVSLYGDSTVSIQNGEYSPNPLVLTTYIQNIGNGNANNVKVYLSFDGNTALSINNSSDKIKNVGTLAPNQEYQCSWNINVNSVAEETIHILTIKVVADGLEDKILHKYITVPAGGKDNRILWGSKKNNGSWSGQDNLSFINEHKSFFKRSGLFGWGSSWKDVYTHISDKYFNLLTEGMSNTVWSCITKDKKEWGGSCYGMSCVVSLMKDGRLDPILYKSKAVNTHDLDAPIKNDKVENLVNFYQLSSLLPDVQEIFCLYTTMNNYQPVALKNIVNEVKKVKNGGLPVVICYNYTLNEIEDNGEHKSGGHAVVGYEVTEGNYTVDGKNYRYMISLCDPNNSAYSYMYINEDYSDWQYPFGLRNTGDEDPNSVLIVNGKQQKAIIGVLSSLNLIDQINPETGGNRTTMKNYNSNFMSKYTSNSAALSVRDSSNNVCQTKTICSPSGSEVTYLPDGQKFKLIPSSSDKNVNCSIVLGNASFDVDATEVGQISINSDGSVKYNGNKSKCDIGLTLNENVQTLNCFRFNISGTNIDSYDINSVENGLVIEGNNLKNTTIIANNRKQAVKVNVSTENTSVMLRDIDDDTIGVYVDNDNNGTYEKLINVSEKYVQDNEKTTFWDKIVAFFKNIFNWIKSLFGG